MSSFGKLLIVAAVVAVSAAASTEAVLMLNPQPALRAARAETRPALAEEPIAPGAGPVIVKAADGHYWAEGQVNGARVRFLVDTGATAVALTPADAQRLGVKLDQLRYGASVVTAAGQTRAAPVKLASITVAGAKLENVDALVIEKGLDTSLLGMAYLGRLSGFEATRRTLVLRQ